MYERFEALLKEKGITTYAVSKETGLNQSMFSHWKSGLYTPKIEKIQKLCDFFGVPITYFYD